MTETASVKIRMRRRVAGIAVALLVLFGLLVVASMQEDKLQVTLSDGTIVTIEKVEVTNKPSYDSRGLLQRIQAWFYARGWGSYIFSKLGINFSGQGALFTQGEYKNESFHVWYSLSNNKRGFFPEMVDEAMANPNNLAGTVSLGFSQCLASLTDEHGCVYSEGEVLFDYYDIGTSVVGVHSISFASFNNSSEKQQLSIKFFEEKEPVIFSLKNPHPHKAPTVSPLAAMLPLQQPLGDVTITLDRLLKTKNGLDPWKPDIRFQRNGVNVQEDFVLVEPELSDLQGGRKGVVCSHAGEWIFKGFVRANQLKAVDSKNRTCAEIRILPQSRKYSPIELPDEAKEFIMKAYLIGAGVYVLDADDIIHVGNIGDLQKGKDIFDKVPRPQNIRYMESFYSDDYWENKKKNSFYWEQEVFNGTTPKLLVVADKPTLVFRASPKNTKRSALILSNSKLNWNFWEKNFSSSRWGAMPLDWKGSDGPQTLEIGYAEALPFEFHILPSEEMRQSVISPIENKTKK